MANFGSRYSHETPRNGSFLVCSAGNIGPSQGLERFLELAEDLRGDPDLLFLFVGKGPSKESLRSETIAKDLSNVRFIDYQPYATVPEAYASSDLCVVSLTPLISDHALTSTVLRLMAARCPILALCDPDSDLGDLIFRSGAGKLLKPRDRHLDSSTVRRLAHARDDSDRMGKAGRAYAIRHFSMENVSSRYSELLNRLAGANRKTFR